MKLRPAVGPDGNPVPCAECGEPIVGPCEFDPDPGRRSLTVERRLVHSTCAAVIEIRRQNARDRVKRAAPDLLAACSDALAFVKYALEFWDWSRFPNSQKSAEQLRDKLAAALDKAGGAARG